MENQQDYQNALLGVRAKRRVFIPDTKLELELRVLSVEDIIGAQSAKKTYLESRGLVGHNICELLEDSVQTLYRSALKTDSDERYFDSPEDIRTMPQEHLLFLVEQLQILSDKHNPNLHDLSEGEIDSLKKKLLSGEELISLSYFQLLSLCRALADSIAISEPPVKSSSSASQDSSPQASGSSTPPSTPESKTSSPNSTPSPNQDQAAKIQKTSPTLPTI